jgi:hypothetical protein
MSATKEYKYAKYIPNKYGQVHLTDKVNLDFTKAYLQDNPNADIDDINDAYELTKKEFYREYVKADETSIQQGKGLNFRAGSGMKTGRGKMTVVDSGNPNDAFNKAIISTTNQGFANPGNVKVVIGNASKENYETNKESDSVASGFMSDFALKIRGKNFKDEKRPKYRMLAQGIAADDDTKSSFTVYPSKEDVDNYFGDSKEVKESGIKERIMSEGISYIYDNTKISSVINEYMNVAPIEKQLLTKGSYTINEFNKTAGTVKIRYNDNTKQTVIEPTYVVYDDSEEGYSLHPVQPIVVNDIKTVQTTVDQLIANLDALQKQNMVTEQNIRLANKSKTQK